MPGVTAGTLSVEEVAPEMLEKVDPPLVLTCHWYPVAPVAVTEKLAFAPAHTETGTGWEVMFAPVTTVSKPC